MIIYKHQISVTHILLISIKLTSWYASNYPPPHIHREDEEPSTKVVRPQRVVYLDTLRVLACFLVVFTHSAMPADESEGVYLSIISLVCSPSSELFLALSGAILLPVKTDMTSFYRRRFIKLLPPVFFWSVVIILIDFISDRCTLSAALELILKIPVSPVVGVYWFIYVIIGLYLFAPFISPWIKLATKRQLEIFLCIWMITLLMPYLNLITPGLYNSNGSYYWVLNCFGGFLGYWVLGYYLRTFPVKIKNNDKRWIFCCTGVICYMTTLLILKFYNLEVIPFLDNLQIGAALVVILIFTIVQSFNTKVEWISSKISVIAKFSFGIYLIHIVIIRDFVWNLFLNSEINPIMEALMISIISVVICCLILKLLHYLPFHKYLIGI